MRIYLLSSYSVGNYCADISAIGPKELNLHAACAYMFVQTNRQNESSFARINTRNSQKMTNDLLLFHTLSKCNLVVYRVIALTSCNPHDGYYTRCNSLYNVVCIQCTNTSNTHAILLLLLNCSTISLMSKLPCCKCSCELVSIHIKNEELVKMARWLHILWRIFPAV